MFTSQIVINVLCILISSFNIPQEKIETSAPKHQTSTEGKQKSSESVSQAEDAPVLEGI